MFNLQEIFECCLKSKLQLQKKVAAKEAKKSPVYLTIERGDDPRDSSGKDIKTLEQWLESLGLIEYLDTFTENGWENLMVLTELTEGDLDRMSIKKMTDRIKILRAVSSLQK